MRRAIASAVATILVPAAAWANPFPTRGGETGILDVPDAETLGLGAGLVAGEMRLDHRSGGPTDLGPLPLSLVFGLGSGLDLGFSLREWGRPGDPSPSPLLVSTALKLQVARPQGLVPGIAAEALLERFNWKPSGGFRLAASTAPVGRFRLAAFAGYELHGAGVPVASGFAGGLALELAHGNGFDTVVEGLAGPGGPELGAALRWAASPRAGAYAAATWIPDQSGWRLSVGFALRAPAPEPRRPAPPAPAPEAPKPPEAAKPAAPVFRDERPRFRLRIPVVRVPGDPGEPRHLQYAPFAAEAPGGAARGARPPTPEEAREARIAGLESQLDARERRLRSIEADLAARDRRLATQAAALDAAERGLAARESRLQEVERALPRGAPPAARVPEAREAKARALEADAGRRERELRGASAEAGRREAQARAREVPLRDAVARDQALLARQKAKARQLELRARIAESRDRHLGATEARLAAGRERLDLLEKSLAARAERVDARQERLAAWEERLGIGRAGVPVPSVRRRAGAKPAMVLVVKPPTSIVKGKPAGPAAPGASRPALHPGVAVEKAVAAATVVYFPNPGQPMRELDREAVESIARLAAREGAEVLVWARAQNPGLMSEAARRAEELKILVAKAGPVPEERVVTRITTRPAAAGVDVVVSALREQGQAGGAAGAAEGPPVLLEGETGKRQLREALLQYRPELESCVEAEMRRQGLASAEAVLRIGVDRKGRVSQLSTASAQLAGADLEQCLRAAAQGWQLPAADADYVVEVPMTLVGPTGAAQ